MAEFRLSLFFFPSKLELMQKLVESRFYVPSAPIKSLKALEMKSSPG